MYPPQRKGNTSSRWCGLMLESILNVCKAFCQQTSIHGFYHIAAPKRHWFERLVWAAVTGVAVWGVADISLGQWRRYRDNPTVVTLQKDFRTWDYTLLGVTACEKNKTDEEKAKKAIKTRWNVGPNNTKYGHYFRFVDMVANADLSHLDGYEEFADDSDLNVDLFELAVEVMYDQRVKLSVDDQITKLPKWVPVMTEAGACHTINSVAVADIALIKPTSNYTRDLPVTCKYSAQGCYFLMEGLYEMNYYIHSAYDIPDTLTEPYYAFPSRNTQTELSTTETRVGPGVRALSPRRRYCHFTDEPTEPNRQVHSTNICRQGCKSRIAVKLCGCKPFYYFYAEGPLCTSAGMRCLAGAAHRLATFDNTRCPCVQQCVDSVFREINTAVQNWGQGPMKLRAAARFMVQPPRMRYTRDIVFHFQDLVVSFGGAAGLFLGASFISFVEIASFCLERLLRPRARRADREPVVKSPIAPYERRIQELNMILQRNTYERYSYYDFP